IGVVFVHGFGSSRFNLQCRRDGYYLLRPKVICDPRAIGVGPLMPATAGLPPDYDQPIGPEDRGAMKNLFNEIAPKLQNLFEQHGIESNLVIGDGAFSMGGNKFVLASMIMHLSTICASNQNPKIIQEIGRAVQHLANCIGGDAPAVVKELARYYSGEKESPVVEKIEGMTPALRGSMDPEMVKKMQENRMNN
ncbi:MAG: alpha/beta hydrolase, partial [Nitrospira sp.]|nr:alpha/beta hydrolase [Nitrospira sp.]